MQLREPDESVSSSCKAVVINIELTRQWQDHHGSRPYSLHSLGNSTQREIWDSILAMFKQFISVDRPASPEPSQLEHPYRFLTKRLLPGDCYTEQIFITADKIDGLLSLCLPSLYLKEPLEGKGEVRIVDIVL